LNYEKPPSSFGDGSTTNSRGPLQNRKLIIIAAFSIGFIALAALFAPLMISSSAMTMAGVDLLSQDTSAAKEHLNLAIEIDPHSSAAYQLRGTLYAQLQQAEKSIADFNKAIEYGAGTDSYFGRAFQYHLLGKFDKALKDYQASLDKGRARKADVYVNQADVLYRLNRLDEAVLACDKTIEEAPAVSTAHLNRAQANIRLGRYQAAIDDLDIALDRTTPEIGNPDLRRDSLWMRAMAYRGLKDTSDADADLDEARKAGRIHHRNRPIAQAAETEFAQRAERIYFVLCTSNLSKAENEDYADRLQSLLKFVDMNVAHVRAGKLLHIFTFQNSALYDAFMSSKNGIKEGTYDSDKNAAAMNVHRSHYDPGSDSIFSYASADTSGLLYTLTQKVLSDSPFIDKWAPQGIALLLTKSYGYTSPTDCQLFLSQNLRTYVLPTSEMPPLIEVINNSRPQPDDVTPMFVALYLLKKGKLQTYLDLCHSGNIGNYSTLFEAAMAKQAPALESDWKSFIADIRNGGPSTETLPNAQIFSTRQRFEEFSKNNPQLQLSSIKGNTKTNGR